MVDKILADKQHRAERKDNSRAEVDNKLKGVQNLRVVFLYVLSLVVDFSGVTVSAYAVNAAVAGSGRNKASRKQLIAGLLFDKIGFARQQALVNLAASLYKNSVGRNLTAP